MKTARFLRRPRFTLAALLVLITVVAIPLSYVAQRRAWNLRRKAAYEALMSKGFQFELMPRNGALSSNEQPNISWWHKLLHEADTPPFKVVTHYGQTTRPPISDMDLHKLVLFPELEGVNFVASPEISDQGLAVVATLRNLKSLSIDVAPNVHGKFLQDLAPVEVLYLDIGFTRENVAFLRRQTKLTMLSIRCAPIVDTDLEFLSRCPPLTGLTFTGMPITGRFLAQIRNCNELRSLHLRSTLITDKEAAELSRFESLYHLDLAWTPVQGEFFGGDSPWTKLTVLNLIGTRFSEHGKDCLAKFTNAEIVYYPSNWTLADGWRLASGTLPGMSSISEVFSDRATADSISARYYQPDLGIDRIDQSSTELMAPVVHLHEQARAEAAEVNKSKQQGDK